MAAPECLSVKKRDTVVVAVGQRFLDFKVMLNVVWEARVQVLFAILDGHNSKMANRRNIREKRMSLYWLDVY